MTTCYVVRHADKEQGNFYNPLLRHQDQPISQKGVLDAQNLAAFFAEKSISAIYISAYQRTFQTIEETARRLQLIPILDPRLNETDTGQIDGLSDAEIQQKFPEIGAALRARNTDFRFPDGETGEEAQGRIIQFLEEKRQQPHEGDLVLVSHDGLIRLLMCYIMNIPVYKRWNFQVDTCGLMEIRYQPDYQAWKLVRFNHLLPAAPQYFPA